MWYSVLNLIFLLRISVVFSASSSDVKSSLVFVFDTTGSMHDDLRQLREGAELILDTALNSRHHAISNFVFMPFNDPGIGPPTITNDKEVLKEALKQTRVFGGGDCKENSLSGILMALKISLKRSYVYVFTDATAGDHKLVDQVLDLVQIKQSQIVFVLTGHCNDLDKPSYLVYHQIAAASSGQVFNLNKASVHKVLDFVRSSVTGRAVNLDSVVNKGGSNYSHQIPVDGSLGEVTVSVSGSNPQITVVNPFGEEINGPPKLITTLDLAEIIVVKVIEPEAGNWTVQVGSKENYSVKIVGQSNLTFEQGFFVQKPDKWIHASYRPLQGAENYMMIKLISPGFLVNISHSEILFLNGSKLFELPLKEVDFGNDLYLTDAFVPPEDFFYVAITGYDENNQLFRRIGATAIQAKYPDAPRLIVPEQINVGSSDNVLLRCEVQSLVPVTAQWYKENKRLQNSVSSLQNTIVEYTISNMNEDKAGVYRCIGRNVAGVSQASTIVSIIVEPPQMTLSCSDKSVMIGEAVYTSCSVYSETILASFQMIVHSYSQNKVFDQNPFENPGVYVLNKSLIIDENDTGLITCRAVNKGGETIKFVSVSILKNPIVKISVDKVKYTINETMQIKCFSSNSNKVKIISPNGTAVYTQNNADLKSYRHTFNIDIVSGKHSGLWSCAAERNSHKASESINITVVLSPIVSIEGSKHLTLQYGTNYTLTCAVKAIPTPNIVWYNDTEFINNTSVTQVSDLEYYSSLDLLNISLNTEHAYFCMASNSEGESNDEVVVSVKKYLSVLEGPKDQSVEINSQTTIFCITDSYPKSEVKWYHNGTILESSDRVHINDNKSLVFIKNMDFKHVGIYSCEISNFYEKLILNATLDIFGFEAPKLLREPTVLYALRGSSVNITCRISKGKPKPHISWSFNNNKLTREINREDNVTVTISEVDLSHEGMYTCRAINDIGTDEYNVSLVVQYAPQLDASGEVDANMEIEVGNRVVLNCSAYSVPPPLVVWTKDFEPISYSDHIYITEENDLMLESVTPQDSGIFICIASNNFGSIHRNFTLNIYALPNITTPEGDPNMEIIEGQLVELFCSVSGHPKPEVMWTHNGDKMVETKRKLLDQEFTLRFIANVTDFGEYICTAHNKFGNVSYTYNVYIWVPPKIKSTIYPLTEVKLGSNVTMKCNAVGFPVPEILWEFNEDIIVGNTSSVSYNNIGDLYFNNVTVEHSGTYVCVAENIAGFDLAHTYLSVSEPPKIVNTYFSGPYIASDKDVSLSIPCEVKGKPAPQVEWIFNDKTLYKDSKYSIDLYGTLTMLSLAEEMSGNYTCVAQNSAGVTNDTAIVNIYTLPQPYSNDESTSITAMEYTSVHITCPIRKTPSDALKWYKNGNLLNSTELKFPNVTRYNESSYECTVSNPIGFASSTVHLTVEWVPIFIQNIYEKDLEVIEGNDLSMVCEVDCKPVCEIKWLWNTVAIENERTMRLFLVNINRDQSGLYTCVATNKYSSITRHLDVNVLVSPYISKFDVLDVQLNVGSNATLHCLSTGWPKPAITWKYNNTNWFVQNSSLVTYNALRSSEGIFRCDATNKAGTQRLLYRVAVFVPATITSVILYENENWKEVINTAEITKGSQAKLTCISDGYPKPSMQVFLNGILMNETNIDSKLEINLNISGVFICNAANEAGGDEKRINIDVLEPPKIYKNLFETNSTDKTTEIESLQGQILYLHCYPYGQPKPHIYWFKDDLHLRVFDDTIVFKDSGNILSIKGLTEGHEGNYSCIAKNKVGQDMLSYLVTVLVPPPSTKNELTKITSKAGNTVSLHCPVDGNPRPQVVWIKHPYIYINEDYNKRMKIQENYTLSINNIEIEDIGKYTCILTNKVGTTQLEFDVNVESPPKILTNNATSNVENQIISLYRSVVLKCPVEGYPEPKIYWLKDGMADTLIERKSKRLKKNKQLVRDTLKLNTNLQNIERALDGALLLIWNVNVKIAGQYICVGENSAGADYRRFNVFVKVPGKLSSWSPWSYCNVTCGAGYQHRNRSCQYNEDNIFIDKSTNQTGFLILDDSTCIGLAVDKRKCTMPSCEEQKAVPRWTSWSPWSTCSSTCGSGSQIRTRKCKSKSAICEGDNYQIRKCLHLPPCEEIINNTIEKNDENRFYEPEATFIAENPSNISQEEFDSTSTSNKIPLNKVFRLMATEKNNSFCEAGSFYEDASNSCKDIDECAIESNMCHSTQICDNIPGGYTCSCQSGFSATGAGQRCMDINECEINKDVCEFACVNTAGGFVCACPSHMRLHPDRRRCIPGPVYRTSAEEIDDDYIFSTNVNFPRKYPIK